MTTTISRYRASTGTDTTTWDWDDNEHLSISRNDYAGFYIEYQAHSRSRVRLEWEGISSVRPWIRKHPKLPAHVLAILDAEFPPPTPPNVCTCGHGVHQHDLRGGGLLGCYLHGCNCIDFDAVPAPCATFTPDPERPGWCTCGWLDDYHRLTPTT